MKQLFFKTNQEQNDKTRQKPGIKAIAQKIAYCIQIRILLPVLLTLFFTFGGWIFTKQFLSYQEAQLLSRTGQLKVAESGFSLRRQADTPSGDPNPSASFHETDATDEPGTFYGTTLSEDLMAQILNSWKFGAVLVSHDPKEGEMNMEQAITAGIGWIHDMSQKGFLPGGLSEHNFSDVSAILYTLEEKPDIPEYLLSRWNISYTIKDIRIILSIHAATGQVWQAEIIAEKDKLPDLLLTETEALLKAAFPFFADSGSELAYEIESDSYRVLITSPEDKISARVWWSLYGNETQKYAMATLMLSSRE